MGIKKEKRERREWLEGKTRGEREKERGGGRGGSGKKAAMSKQELKDYFEGKITKAPFILFAVAFLSVQL